MRLQFCLRPIYLNKYFNFSRERKVPFLWHDKQVKYTNFDDCSVMFTDRELRCWKTAPNRNFKYELKKL